MLARLFPKQIDNGFGGPAIAIWLLALIVLLRLVMGFNTMVMTDEVLRNADGVPLDMFNAPAVLAVVSLTKTSALRHLLLTLAGVVTLVRYRAAIPLIYLLFLVEQVGRRVIAELDPMPHAIGAAPPFGHAINLGLLAALVIGLVLSLQRKSGEVAREGA